MDLNHNMNINLKKEIKRYFMMILACVLYAFSLDCFLVPNSIVAGGISGLATLLSRYIPISVGIIIIACNIPILIISFFEEGVKFTINCLVTTVCLGLATTLFERVPAIVKDNGLMGAVFGGVIQGVAIGLFCKYRVSSGGTELLGRFLHNLMPFLSIPVFTAMLDGIIVVSGAICMKSISNVLYALIVIFLSAKMSDMIIIGLNRSKLCYIVTDMPDEIGNYLINHSPRGVTKIDGVGMYSKLDKGILMTVVKAGQLNELKEMVSAIDSKAFVIVSDTSEVLGNGFKEIKNEDMLAHEKRFKMKKK